MGVLLGIDLGTSGVRASLITPEGVLVGLGAQEYPILTPRLGWAEQDPATWWTATCGAIRQALGQSIVRPEEVTGVGLAGQMHGLVLLDRSGAPVRPAIIWPDTRSTAECAEIEGEIGKDRLYRITGLPTATGFFGVSLLWVRRHEPGNFAKAHKAILPKDYIRYRLTGEYATDPTDGSGTLLFDVGRRTWSGEIMEALGLERDLLPPVLESSVIAGHLGLEGAGETGLARGTPVAAGGGDQAMGAIGSGVVEEGVVACAIGTGGQVVTTVGNPVLDPHGRLHTLCHAMTDSWLLMGAMLAAGLSLRWFRDTLGEAILRAGAPYAILSTEAETVEPGARGLLFLPYLNGERTPHMDPCARGCLVGLSLSHTRAHIVRAIMEGVTFGMEDSLSIFRELGIPLTTTICSGGGARSLLWRQIQADVYGTPVWTLSREETSSYGASLVAGVATGVYRDIREASRRNVQMVDVLHPVEERQRVYERQYKIYRALYPALRPTFAALA
jgi:xylulokinase